MFLEATDEIIQTLNTRNWNINETKYNISITHIKANKTKTYLSEKCLGKTDIT